MTKTTLTKVTLTHDEVLTALAALCGLDPQKTNMNIVPYKDDRGKDNYAVVLTKEEASHE